MSTNRRTLACAAGVLCALAATSAFARESPPSETQPASVVSTPKSELVLVAEEIANLKEQLQRLDAAVAGGLEAASVQSEIDDLRAKLAEREQRFAELAAARSATTEPAAQSALAAQVQSLETTVLRLQRDLGRLEMRTAGAPTEPVVREVRTRKLTLPSEQHAALLVDLLPLEFTAFGDFYYLYSRGESDDFHIGSVELDVSLKLTPFVAVSTALVYSGKTDSFGLGAFVIDCGLVGEGDGHLVQSKALVKSGVSFGRFDVPFGIAYLEYPAVNNRLGTTPQAVIATHNAWNDIGAQAYALAKYWSVLGYVVNGPQVPVDQDRSRPARTTIGGRASAKTPAQLEVGASLAGNFVSARERMDFVGGDLSVVLGLVDVRGEYLLKHVNVPGLAAYTHGAYSRLVLDLHPVFLVARYDTVLEGATTVDRRVTGGTAVEIFPHGEVRAIYEQSLDTDTRTVFLQLVGGSTFQPTGLRR
ncbi:MAG TPA: hypothetical protein VGC79_18530 [Polyangiaceae bacterium]